MSKQLRRRHDVVVLESLALFNAQYHARTVDVGGPLGEGLRRHADPQRNRPSGVSADGNAEPSSKLGDHGEGRCSLTGGYVYRASQALIASGAYTYAAFCTGEVFMLYGGVARVILAAGLNVSSFGDDEAGEYMLLVSETQFIVW